MASHADRPGPEEVSSSAARFGQRLAFETTLAGISIQQYECRPGSWWHAGLAHCRIAVQQTGSPRLERVIDGRSESQIRPAGSVSISPANAFQRWTWDRPQRVIILYLGQVLIDQVAYEWGARTGRHVTPLVAHDEVIKHTIFSLLHECRTIGVGSKLLFSAAGRHMAAHLLARYAFKTPDRTTKAALTDRRLKRALDFIEDHLSQDIGLDEIAQAALMTPDHFARAFKAAVGMPAYRFFMSRRLEKAKILLTTTNDDLSSIALETGFSSHSHFSAAFRHYVGCTPSAFRLSAGS